ncbi:MAG: SLATT domain-containing protein [Bacteroidota bacterium]
MNEDLLKEEPIATTDGDKAAKDLPKIVPPIEENSIPDTGYKYILTEVTSDRYQPKHQEEIAEAQGKLSKLKNRIAIDIKFYKNERKKNKIRAFFIRVMSTFMAAVITILLGLNIEGFEKTFSTIALIISGFLTVISILQKLLDSKDLWVQYTSTVSHLEGLQFSIEYLEAGKNALRLRDVEFVKLKYDKIMNDTANFVIKVRNDTGDE